MKTLKSLTFAAPLSKHRNPVAMRRAKLIDHLEHQKQLAENPMHVRTTQKWVVQDNGIKAPVELTKRVRPWWRTDDDGVVYFNLRYGNKTLEFEKGKSAILIKDKAQLVPTIDTLIAAVRAGEFDALLTAQSASRGVPSRRRAP